MNIMLELENDRCCMHLGFWIRKGQCCQVCEQGETLSWSLLFGKCWRSFFIQQTAKLLIKISSWRFMFMCLVTVILLYIFSSLTFQVYPNQDGHHSTLAITKMATKQSCFTDVQLQFGFYLLRIILNTYSKS